MKLTDELWYRWKGLVYKIAKKRLCFFSLFGYELEDLVQIGAIGLNKGLSSYKEDYKGCSLSSFLYRCIDCEILIEFQKINTSKRKLNSTSLSLETPIDGKLLTIEDIIKDETVDVSMEIEDKLMAKYINTEMKSILDKKKYEILYLKAFKQLNYSQISKLLNMSYSGVEHSCKRAKEDLIRESSYFRNKYKEYQEEIFGRVENKYNISAESSAINRISILSSLLDIL